MDSSTLTGSADNGGAHSRPSKAIVLPNTPGLRRLSPPIPANCEETAERPRTAGHRCGPTRAPWPGSGVRAGTRAIFASGQNRRVDLARVGWIVTVVACLVAVLILLLQGYYGYALVTFAVAVSAAFNLT